MKGHRILYLMYNVYNEETPNPTHHPPDFKIRNKNVYNEETPS